MYHDVRLNFVPTALPDNLTSQKLSSTSILVLYVDGLSLFPKRHRQNNFGVISFCES